jgi:hypothetical protein
MFQVGLFWVQLKLIGESLTDAKTAADAAKESADAAKQSADHIPRVERAYLFLSLDYKATFKDFELGYAGDTSKHSIMEFGFKNHGRTRPWSRAYTPQLVIVLVPIGPTWRAQKASPSNRDLR